MSSGIQIKTSSKWCGFFGGWGSETDIARHVEAETTGGWRLARTEAATFWWLFLVPRKKVLFIYEREG